MSRSRALLDSFGARRTLDIGGVAHDIASLAALADGAHPEVRRLPHSLRVLLENLLRREDGVTVTKAHIDALLSWDPHAEPSTEIAFMPARVLLQDFTGVPCVVDLAAMRDVSAEHGVDPRRINPSIPVDLVIDHSVQVDEFGDAQAYARNVALEYERNGERYALLRWAAGAFDGFRVVPPGTGIVHQINLEYLASVVFRGGTAERPALWPDTVVGTDSHTTMVNGMGVLGWGVGGIEAEAAMLGQPITMLVPQVVGMRLTGSLQEGATATDLVLTATQVLRKAGVVGKFVEFFGPGLASLSLADRATLANMAPEYGATMGFFPIDEETLAYLRFSGRSDEDVHRVEAYARAQGLFASADDDILFSSVIELDLSRIEPSLAGPKRPQDRVPLGGMRASFRAAHAEIVASASGAGREGAATAIATEPDTLTHGAVVLAAITSCTNTSNPSVMVAAGLVARKARALGLHARPWVKTSLAPGSRVVTRYLEAAGLLDDLAAVGFALVGYGCTTCIGNSGPLIPEVSRRVADDDLHVAAVLSGNRNFEGRINAQVKSNYLASPPLVVAYALAGTVDRDLTTEPIGIGRDGRPVFLKDLWPTSHEVAQAVGRAVRPEQFAEEYASVFEGDAVWRELPVPRGDRFAWDRDSTYVRRPSFLEDVPDRPVPPTDVRGARLLALLGDYVTTDHISPAGSIQAKGPAGRWLVEHGVAPKDFNSYGSRRGNHQVMVRGTFANVRLRNRLAPGTEGGFTTHRPSGEVVPIYEAALRYEREGVPTLLVVGEGYGMGSSRDWAAKGALLLGVRAVLARSFERIHRSNLIGMGVLPLELEGGGDPAEALALVGDETFDLTGIAANLVPGARLELTVHRADGTVTTVAVRSRIDTPDEVEYYRHGGILPFVLRQVWAASRARSSS